MVVRSSSRFVGLGVALALFCVATPSFAQLSGTIEGSVFDEGGSPLKGVTVTASSPTHMGARTAVTGLDGGFRLVSLMPGIFRVSATVPGMKSAVQTGVRVGTANVAGVYLIMEVNGSEEEFVIERKAPTVNVSNATMTKSFDEEFLNNLPLSSRSTVQDIMSATAAGVSTQGNLRVMGGGGSQNLSQIDGFQINDVNGGRGQIITLQTVASLEMQTAGYGAENANAPGSVMNAVTKSGSNKLEVEASGFHENSALRFFPDSLDGKNFDYNSTLTLSVSGPIIKDRLWYFVTLEGRQSVIDRGKDPSGINADPPDASDASFRSIGKITWQVTPRNKLSVLYIINRDHFKNGQGGFSNAREAQWGMDNLNVFGGLSWEALLSDNLIFQSRLGYQIDGQNFTPMLCYTKPEQCDHISPNRINQPFFEFQNWNFHRRTDSNSLEFKNTLEYFLNSSTVGDHSVRLTARAYISNLENKETTPGDVIYVFQNNQPFSTRELFVNDPFLEQGRGGWAISQSKARLFQLSLQDQFKFPFYRYLTITPGVGVISSRSEGRTGTGVIDFTTVTPHIAASWNATHDGRTAVRASFNQHIDAGNLAVTNFVGQARTLKVCLWDPATNGFTKDCVFSGGPSGRTVGLPCGPSGLNPDGSSCKESLGVPRTWEYTLGAEREVLQGVSLGGDFVYRKFINPYEDRETNRVWAPSGSTLDVNGGFKNGRAQEILDLGTPSSAKRDYKGFTLNLRKREGWIRSQLAYTLSELRGNVLDGFQNALLNNPSQDIYQYGYLPGDSRHGIRFETTMRFTDWLYGGVVYSFNSGSPWSPQYLNPVTNNFNDLRAPIGFTPGVDINDPKDDRPNRLPDLQTLNFQARVNLIPLIKVNAEFFVDILNALATRGTLAVESNTSSATFGFPTSRQPQMRARVGFRFKY